MFIEQETKFEDVEKWTKNIPQEGILQVLTDIANDLYTVETFARDVRCGIYTAPKGQVKDSLPLKCESNLEGVI